MELFELLEHFLHNAAEYIILFLEFVGVIVIAFSGLKGVWGCIKRDPLTRLNLAKGMAMGLEFKLGGEILRTVVVRELSEIAIVAAIIALRAALTFLIHWEIKNEQTEITAEAELEATLHHAEEIRHDMESK